MNRETASVARPADPRSERHALRDGSAPDLSTAWPLLGQGSAAAGLWAAVEDRLGGPARPRWLRHKPGRSTAAALVDTAGRPAGWALVVTPAALSKAQAVRRQAHRDGRDGRVTLVGLPGDRWLLCGPLGSDPRLRKALAEVGGAIPDVDAAARAGELRVLRHNPFRRLVLRQPAGHDRGPSRVVRLHAGRVRDPGWLNSVAAAGVPLPLPWDGVRQRDAGLGGRRRVTVWPWADGIDLATRPDPAAARLAGARIAQLHAMPVESLPDLPVARRAGAAVGVHALSALDADLGRAAGELQRDLGRRLSRGAAGRGPVLIHGDFSADQVVTGRDGLWILDWDRAALGDPETDLATFAAAEWVRTGGWGLTPHLLAGYRADAGPERAWAGEDHLLPWVAERLLARAPEPFRRAEQDWRAGLGHRLDQVVGLLAEAAA